MLGEGRGVLPSGVMRALAIGDPQTTLPRFLSALRAHDALTPGDRLRQDVRLLSIGDHFDFKPPAGWSVADTGREGLRILAWLSGHPAEQVQILMGNHDVCRVMELHRIDDAAFAQARSADPADFAARFPDIPTQDIVRRDFSAFSVAQREVVQRLLLSGRMRLASTGTTHGGRPVLLTHAGVTLRELSLLGIPDAREPAVIAAALNALLDERLERVRGAWEAGEPAPLDLSPVHLAGVSGQEGGGLLYHRPQSSPLDAWAQRGARRFHPSRLPDGLLQVCGHTQHRKMRELLEAVPELPEGSLRSMWFDETTRYQSGLADREAGALWMIDSGLNHAEAPALLSLASLH